MRREKKMEIGSRKGNESASLIHSVVRALRGWIAYNPRDITDHKENKESLLKFLDNHSQDHPDMKELKKTLSIPIPVLDIHTTLFSQRRATNTKPNGKLEDFTPQQIARYSFPFPQ